MRQKVPFLARDSVTQLFWGWGLQKLPGNLRKGGMMPALTLILSPSHFPTPASQQLCEVEAVTAPFCRQGN